MNKNSIWLLSLATLVLAHTWVYSAENFARASSPMQGTPITSLQDLSSLVPLGSIVIKSKVAVPLYMTFFNDSFTKPITIGSSGIITLRENDQIVIDSIKKDGQLVVLMTTDRAKLESALAITNNNKRDDYIRDQVGSTSDMYYFKPKFNEVFLIYKNNMGLIPGLLRGVGEVRERTRVSTRPGKVCDLRLAYKRDKSNFTIEQKPAEYKAAAQKSAKASSLPTIEGVIDDVVAFEKAKGL